MVKAQAAISDNRDFTVTKLQSYRILVVDDDKACALMMMWTLEELGQEAQIVNDDRHHPCYKFTA